MVCVKGVVCSGSGRVEKLEVMTEGQTGSKLHGRAGSTNDGFAGWQATVRHLVIHDPGTLPRTAMSARAWAWAWLPLRRAGLAGEKMAVVMDLGRTDAHDYSWPLDARGAWQRQGWMGAWHHSHASATHQHPQEPRIGTAEMGAVQPSRPLHWLCHGFVGFVTNGPRARRSSAVVAHHTAAATQSLDGRAQWRALATDPIIAVRRICQDRDGSRGRRGLRGPGDPNMCAARAMMISTDRHGASASARLQHRAARNTTSAPRHATARRTMMLELQFQPTVEYSAGRSSQ
ncbi:hypothetical protein P171DRAFT_495340 [Karstenula rhodostoma CBS 690.94]|uniref:Uncharacterized protein n=1 Tax=Karstenula rhodostoma CBS 690.94 TaxID=1392251 RepID=A0A9P4PEH9_9PLEO|nr:hypothetical protein P171DRAFT_495340 [Karstenula rhodostoma CBS 690.94]